MARYGSIKSFLIIFSARDDLVKVSWKSDAGKCRNQQTPPYFDELSERYQPLWDLIGSTRSCYSWCPPPWIIILLLSVLLYTTRRPFTSSQLNVNHRCGIQWRLHLNTWWKTRLQQLEGRQGLRSWEVRIQWQWWLWGDERDAVEDSGEEESRADIGDTFEQQVGTRCATFYRKKWFCYNLNGLAVSTWYRWYDFTMPDSLLLG